MRKRTFIIGEEWLYYKIYCGAKTADIMLTTYIKPLVSTLTEQNYIDKWFFIRYNDPDLHIRLRFHIIDTKQIGAVILKIKNVLTKQIKNESVYKVHVATYNRELARYGIETIHLAETLFYHDSSCIVNALQLIEDEEVLLLFALKNCCDLLDNFNLSNDEKLKFVNTQMNYFKDEFSVNKTVNKQLSKKYATRKQAIEQFIENKSTKDEKVLYNLLDKKSTKDKSIILNLIHYKDTSTVENKLSSFIHMSINRTFRSKQRMYEMLCYDFLVRYYKTKIAKTTYKL